MILYGSSMSPYVRKVLAFAAEKGIELEHKPLGLGSDDPSFRAASPFGKSPLSPTVISPSPTVRRSSPTWRQSTRSRR